MGAFKYTKAQKRKIAGFDAIVRKYMDKDKSKTETKTQKL